MLAYVTPLTLDKDGDLILSIPDVNHNELNPHILYEIINNTLDNICNMDALKIQDMGQDMVMFAIKWNKVSLQLLNQDNFSMFSIKYHKLTNIVLFNYI